MINLKLERDRFFNKYSDIKKTILEEEKLESISSIFENPHKKAIPDININFDLKTIEQNRDKAASSIKKKNIKGVLFSHFTYEKNEFDSFDFPALIKKAHPELKVYISYVKTLTNCTFWRIDDDAVDEVDENEVIENTNIVISRSTSMNILVERNNLFLNKIRVNVMPMGVKRNYPNIHFLIKDFYRPPSPIFREKCKKTLEKIQKKNLIIVSGSIREEKNNHFFLQNIDNYLVNKFNYEILFIGDCRSEYANKLKMIANEKNLCTYFLGQLPHKYVHFFYCYSKIHCINTKVSVYSPTQLYDPGPRCIGEAIAGNCHSLISEEVLSKSVEKIYCTKYIFNDSKLHNLNLKLLECFKHVNENKIEYNKTSITLEVTGLNLFNNILELIP